MSRPLNRTPIHRWRSTNHMAEARAELLAARAPSDAAANQAARLELYAACERAPIGWEKKA